MRTVLASRLPHVGGRGRTTVTQRSIEMVIGRLMTDEEFRERFQTDPHETLCVLVERGGTDLTEAEVAALVSMEADFWERVAEQVDPRLQKANLKS